MDSSRLPGSPGNRSSTDPRVAAALRCANRGLLREAERELRTALVHDAQQPDLLVNLAVVLVRRKEFGTAYDVLMSGLRGPATDARYLRQAAIYCVMIDALDAATALLQRFIAQVPSDFEARFFHADVLARRGRIQEAQATLDQALEDAQDASVADAALQPLWTLGRYKILEELLSRRPTDRNAIAEFRTGTVRLRMGRIAEALQSLNSSASAAPDHAATWFNLGLCHQLHNNVPVAIESWKEAARLAPANEHFSNHLEEFWLQAFANGVVEGGRDSAFEKIVQRTLDDPIPYGAACSFLISCGLFAVVHDLSARFSEKNAGDPAGNSAFSSAMGRCLAREISTIAQMDYEIAEYGHLDIRKFPDQRTRFTDFLWKSSAEIGDEALGMRRLALTQPESEDDCLEFCRAQLQRGNIGAVLEATTGFLEKSSEPSEPVALANIFAEYVAGGRLAARHRLNAVRSHGDYILGSYSPAAAVAVHAERVAATGRHPAHRITMDVWCSGSRHVVEQQLSIPSPTLYWLDDPILLNDHGTLMVGDGTIVRETINCDPGRYIYGWPNLVHSSGEHVLIRCPQVGDRIGDPVVLASHSRDQASYAHWMLDILPRILIAAEDPRTRGMPILMTRDLTAWQVDVLSLCRVDLDRVVSVDVDAPVRLSRAILPMTNKDLYPAPEAIRLVRSRIGRPDRPKGIRGGRRLYVPRRANFRRLLNDEAIANYLHGLGFEPISPGEMSIAEQRDAFSSAEVVVAVGGAAVTNILYMPSGSTAVVLGPVTNYGTYFAHLAAELGVNYCGVVGPPKPDLVNTYVAWNFSVGLEDLDLALHSACPRIFR